MSSSAMEEESLVDCEGGEIKYDAAKVIEVFVGLNTQDINVAIERNRDLHQRQVEKVRKVQLSGLAKSGINGPCGRGAVVERTPSVTKVVSSISAQSEEDFVGDWSWSL